MSGNVRFIVGRKAVPASVVPADLQIDLDVDDVGLIADVAERVLGVRPRCDTALKWKGMGRRGVKLHAVKQNGCWVTTEKAFEAFMRESGLTQKTFAMGSGVKAAG